nr:DNA methylase [Ardenticatenales bacterium]
ANVQYAELMDFCYVWLKRHLAAHHGAFARVSTRTGAELTVNQTEGRDIAHFTDGLSQVFSSFARALKPGGPFVFTYHHNDLTAYLPIAAALLDASLVCTVALPCPAEMGASIHISGTRSSVVDTIFVCRSTGVIRANDFEPSMQNLKQLLRIDLVQLQQAKLKPTVGDARCLLLGHLTRLAVWYLRPEWNPSLLAGEKLVQVKAKIEEFCPMAQIGQLADEIVAGLAEIGLFAVLMEERASYDVSF